MRPPWPAGPRSGTSERTPRSGAAQAALLAALVTLVVAAPVLVAPGHRLFGPELVGRHHDPFTVIEQLRGGDFSFPYFQPVTDGVGHLLALALGPVAALNVLTLASFPLAAAALYVLARRAGVSPAGSLAAAFLYAFAPFHVAHAAYHPHVAQTQWLPLYALALWRALEDATPRRLVQLATASLVLSLSNFYWGLVGAVITIPVLAAVLVAAGRDPRRIRSWRRTTLTLAGLAVVAVGGIAALAPGVLATHRFPDKDAALFSARWWSYLLPPAVHPLLGTWSRGVWARGGLSESLVEQQVGLGWSVLALAAVAVVRATRGRDPALRAVPWCVGIGALAAVASTPGGASWLHVASPAFRAYARFGVVVQLAAALLAGVGAGVLLRGGSRGRGAAATLLLAAAFEYAPLPPWPWRDVLPTRGHRWLAEKSARGAVLDCVRPSVPEHSLPQLLGRPLTFVGPPIDDCGAPDLADRLAAAGFTHVVVRRGTPVARWLDASGPRGGLRVATDAGDSVVLAVDGPRPSSFVVDLAGFADREYDGRRTWRWMGRTGRLSISSTAPGPTRVSLEAELSAFPAARRLDVFLDGVLVAGLEVSPEPRRHTVGPMVVRAGTNTLDLRPREPPVVADAVLGNGDRRELSIALGEWRWRPAGGASGPGDDGRQQVSVPAHRGHAPAQPIE